MALVLARKGRIPLHLLDLNSITPIAFGTVKRCVGATNHGVQSVMPSLHKMGHADAHCEFWRHCLRAKVALNALSHLNRLFLGGVRQDDEKFLTTISTDD